MKDLYEYYKDCHPLRDSQVSLDTCKKIEDTITIYYESNDDIATQLYLSHEIPFVVSAPMNEICANSFLPSDRWSRKR